MPSVSPIIDIDDRTKKCECIVTDRLTIDWRTAHGVSLVCGQTAKYSIEGKSCCSRHAPIEAWRILMRRR